MRITPFPLQERDKENPRRHLDEITQNLLNKIKKKKRSSHKKRKDIH